MDRESITTRDAARRVDMVFLTDGKPTAVIEVKGRPIRQEYHRAVLEQIRHYAQLADSPWSLLVDPIAVRVFSRDLVEQPVATIPSELVLGWSGLDTTRAVGERTLLLAVEWWLSDKELLARLPEQFPKLSEFAHDLRRSDEVMRDAIV
jgi:hypothetical protein